MSFCANKLYQDLQNEKDKDLQDMAKHLKKSDLVKLVKDIKASVKNYRSTGLDTPSAMEKAINNKMEQARIASESNKKFARMALIAKEKKNAQAKMLNYDIKKIESSAFDASKHQGTGVRMGAENNQLALTTEILHGPKGIVPQLEKIDAIKALNGNSLQEFKHIAQQSMFMSPDDPTLPLNYEVAQKIIDQNFDDTYAGKIAKIFKDHDDFKRALYAEHGIEVPELYDRITRQYNDTNKILRPNGFHKAMMNELGVTGSKSTRWAKYLLAQKNLGAVALDKMQRDVAYKMWKDVRLKDLDMARSFPNTDITDKDAIDQEMRDRFDKMTAPSNPNDLLNTDKLGDDDNYSSGSMFQDMASHGRSFHVTTGKAFVDYSMTYGAGNLLASIEREAHTLGHGMAMVHEWGPNPISTYKQFIKENFGDRTDRQSREAIKRMNRKMAYLSGQLRPDADHMLGRFSKVIQTYNAITSLGMVTFRSFPDAALNWRQLNSWGASLQTQIQAQMDGLMAGKNNEQLRELFSNLGVMSRHMIGNRHVIDARSFKGMGSKYEALMMKMNMLPHWDLSRKRVAFAGLAHHLATYADTAYKDLPQTIKNKFDLYALNENEWNAWRKGATKLEDGLKYISPHHALEASDADIMATHDLNDLDATPSQMKNILYRKLSAMYHGEYKYVVPGNSLEARAAKAFHNQTVGGQVLNLVMQFKGYAMGYIKNVLGRDIGEAGSYTQAGWNVLITIASTAGLEMLSQFAVNAMENKQTSFNPFSHNKKERNDAEHNWWQSIQSAMGLFGDSIHLFSTSNTANAFISMLGPTASKAVNISSYIYEMGQHFINTIEHKQNRDRKSAALLTEHAIANNLPYHNTPIVTMLMHHLLSKVFMDMIQPGSYEQQVNEMKNKYGVTPLFN